MQTRAPLHSHLSAQSSARTLTMETRSTSSWTCLYPIMWLWLISYAGSSPLTSVVHTWSGVGHQAILPCTWKSHVGASSQLPYIQWETVTDTVFERIGERSFQGEAFRNRVDVPKEMLEEGNCSLFFTDVQFGDAGIYESYLVVGRSTIKKRIFLQSVQLLVFDHKLRSSVESGKDLYLETYTSHAETLVFESSEGSGWIELWQRSKERNKNGTSRVEEVEGKLVVRRVRASDSGIYKVLDADGLALSTVRVSVTDSAPNKATVLFEKQSAFSSVRLNSPSLFVTASLLLSTLTLNLL